MISMHETLVDVMSESAMITSEVPRRLVPNAFAIGAFEVHPKPEMPKKSGSICHHVSQNLF